MYSTVKRVAETPTRPKRNVNSSQTQVQINEDTVEECKDSVLGGCKFDTSNEPDAKVTSVVQNTRKSTKKVSTTASAKSKVIPITRRSSRTRRPILKDNCAETIQNADEYIQDSNKRSRTVTKHICNTCSLSFTKPYFLKEHNRLDSGEKPFKCNQCSGRFRLKKYLNEHMLRHRTNKNSKCIQCGVENSTKADLVLTMRHNSGDRGYACTVCGKAFARKSDFNINLRIYTVKNRFALIKFYNTSAHSFACKDETI